MRNDKGQAIIISSLGLSKSGGKDHWKYQSHGVEKPGFGQIISKGTEIQQAHGSRQEASRRQHKEEDETGAQMVCEGKGELHIGASWSVWEILIYTYVQFSVFPALDK